MKDITWHKTQFIIDEEKTQTLYDHQIICHSPILDCYRQYLADMFAPSVFFKETVLDANKPTRIIYRHLKDDHKYQAQISYLLYGSISKSYYQTFPHFNLAFSSYKKDMVRIELSNVCISEEEVNKFVVPVEDHLSITIEEDAVRSLPYRLYQMPEGIENSSESCGSTFILEPYDGTLRIHSPGTTSIWKENIDIRHMLLYLTNGFPMYFTYDIRLHREKEAIRIFQSDYLHVKKEHFDKWKQCGRTWLQISLIFLLSGILGFFGVNRISGATLILVSCCILVNIFLKYARIQPLLENYLNSDENVD